MGCTSSKEVDESPQAHELQIRHLPRSLEQQRLTPRPQRDPVTSMPLRHEEHELNRGTLQRALANMARYLSRNGQNITVVAVGGAVNTILLQTRDTTHDIDFFNSNLSGSQISLLSTAGHEAQDEASRPLGGNFFNNETTLLMPKRVVALVTRMAFKQNEVVFEAPGLRVLAAPWHYAFCAKVERMGKPRRKSYDINDAVIYLRHHIERHGNAMVTIGEIREWGHMFGIAVGDSALREVDALYRRMFGRPAISS